MDHLSPAAGHAPVVPAYERHRPEETVLYGVVQAELETFLARARDRPLPRFVERELRGFLACGILAHGFLRVHCDACGRDRIVAFSCKGRGFCPSWGGRRTGRLLARRGLGPDADPAEADPLAFEQPLLAGLTAASVRGQTPGGGHPARRGDRIDPDDLSQAGARQCAAAMGFTLHAGVAVPARDRRRLERLCRYAARPPVAAK